MNILTEEDIPEPRSAEELLVLRDKQQKARERKSKANGIAMMEDSFR